MGHLSTHVLDTRDGRPAAGVALHLYRLDAGGRHWLLTAHTNAEGRSDGPLLAGTDFTAGRYELRFAIGAYFRAAGPAPDGLPFLDEVPLEFGVSDPDAHYHVPLLCTPWSYSVYRGS